MSSDSRVYYIGIQLLGERVPAADAKASQESMDQTFLLTNIAPQVGAGFNRHCKILLVVFYVIELTAP